MSARGCFWVFEGLDGSGKTTQASLLASRLRMAGKTVYQTCEPTEGPVGQLIRQYMRGGWHTDERVIAALFAADRLDHLLGHTDELLARLDRGEDVVCDRYYVSSYAYQTPAAPLAWLRELNAQSAALARPTAHFYLDIEPRAALERLSRTRAHMERYEALSKLTQARARFAEAMEALRREERFFVLPAQETQESIAEKIWGFVRTLSVSG